MRVRCCNIRPSDPRGRGQDFEAEEQLEKRQGAKTMDGPFNVRSASILVVDDVDADARLIEAMLTGSGYTRVASTNDPRQVAELHRRNRYDLIVLDLMMPGMDGFAVMEALRPIENPAYLPVLAITAEPDLMRRALEAGARDFISKPVSRVELTARVHNLLETRLLLRHVQDNGEKLEGMLRESTESLRKSEELFRLFAANVPEGIFIRGVEKKVYRYFNSAFEALTGRRLAVGGPIETGLESIHPQDRDAVLDEMRRNPLGGVDREMRFVHPDGGVRWGHARTFPIADPEGQIRWIAGIIEDITERKRTQEALRESEGRFRALVEQSIVGIYVVEEGRFTYANPRMCQMLGYSERELREIVIADLVVEEDRERFAENRRRRDAGDPTALVATYRMHRKEGGVIHLAVDGRELELRGRKVLFGIGQDITERVRAQELLNEAESHYRALVEQSLVGICIISGSRMIYANPQLQQILGYTLDELASREVRDLLVPEDHALIDQIVERRRAGEAGSISVKCRARRKDGAVVHLSIETKIIDLAGRKAALGLVQDTSERAHAAVALRESEEKFRLLWETATDAVILMGDDMRIQYANPSVRQV